MMSKAVRAVAWALLALLVTLGATSRVEARLLRPNAIDRRVTAISAGDLLSKPATALVDPERQVAAQRLVRWRVPGFFAMVVLQIAALAYFWRSGAAAAVRDALRARLRGEFAVRFVFGALLALLAKCAALVPSFYLFRVAYAMGISNELARRWTTDWLTTLGISMIAAGLVAAIVLWLADRTHQWYVYTIAGIFAVSFGVAYLGPSTVLPLFERTHDVGPQLASRIAVLERNARLSGLPVRLEERSQRTQLGSARLYGAGATREIVLADTLVAGATPPETLFVTARELGHAARDDGLRVALLNALIFVFGTAFAVFIADRAGFRRDDDPVSRLALVGALLGCAYLVALPIYNVSMRAMERRADSYALALTADPAAATRAMVRLSDEHLAEVCPSLVVRLYFSQYPSIAERVAVFNGQPRSCP